MRVPIVSGKRLEISTANRLMRLRSRLEKAAMYVLLQQEKYSWVCRFLSFFIRKIHIILQQPVIRNYSAEISHTSLETLGAMVSGIALEYMFRAPSRVLRIHQT